MGDKISSTNVGSRIREIRKQWNFSQAALGESLGVSHSYISKVENGIEVPSNSLILKIADLLDINERWLIYGTGPKQPNVNKKIMDVIEKEAPDLAIDAAFRLALAREYDKTYHVLKTDKSAYGYIPAIDNPVLAEVIDEFQELADKQEEMVFTLKELVQILNNDTYFQKMMKYLITTYKEGDNDIKGWIKIQFQRAFPEFKEWLESQHDFNSEGNL